MGPPPSKPRTARLCAFYGSGPRISPLVQRYENGTALARQPTFGVLLRWPRSSKPSPASGKPSSPKKAILPPSKPSEPIAWTHHFKDEMVRPSTAAPTRLASRLGRGAPFPIVSWPHRTRSASVRGTRFPLLGRTQPEPRLAETSIPPLSAAATPT